MTAPETWRLKIKVNVGTFRAGDGPVDVRAGYAQTLVNMGYATRLDNLADALSAEPLHYGEWETDPRASAEQAEGEVFDLEGDMRQIPEVDGFDGDTFTVDG